MVRGSKALGEVRGQKDGRALDGLQRLRGRQRAPPPRVGGLLRRDLRFGGFVLLLLAQASQRRRGVLSLLAFEVRFHLFPSRQTLLPYLIIIRLNLSNLPIAISLIILIMARIGRVLLCGIIAFKP